MLPAAAFVNGTSLVLDGGWTAPPARRLARSSRGDQKPPYAGAN